MGANGRRDGAGRWPKAVGWLVEAGCWAVPSLGLWLVTLSAVSLQDLVIGSFCAVLCGVTATAVRRAVEGGWRVPARFLRPLPALPVAVVTDTLHVLLAPWRRDRSGGGVGSVALGFRGDSPRARTERAVVTAVVSSSPSSVVIDAEPDRGEVTLHSFAQRGRSMLERFEQVAPRADDRSS